MKKQLLIILLSLISLVGYSQTYNTLPAGSTPYGNQLYKTPDGLIIAGTGSAKFRVIGTKQYVDSLMAVTSATVANIADLQSYSGYAVSVIVSDFLRGGIFNFVTSGVVDNGTIFSATGKGSGVWVRQYNSSQIFASWFGVLGDSITDNTAALNAMFQTEAANNTTIIFPKGRILISDYITVPKACSIVGNGGMRRPDNGYDTVLTVLRGNTNIVQINGNKGGFYVSANGVNFRDISIINSSVTNSTAGAGIYFFDGTRARLNNVSVTQFFVNVEFYAGYYWVIDQCELAGATKYNLFIENDLYPDAGDMAISNSYIIGGHVADMVGIYQKHAGGLKITNCKFQLNLETNAVKGWIDANFEGSTVLFLASNNSFENFKEFGIRIRTTGAGTFSLIQLNGNTLDPTFDAYEARSIWIEGQIGQPIGLVNVTNNNILVRNVLGAGIYTNYVQSAVFDNAIFSTIGSTNLYDFNNTAFISRNLKGAIFVDKDYLPDVLPATHYPILSVNPANGLLSKYDFTTLFANLPIPTLNSVLNSGKLVYNSTSGSIGAYAADVILNYGFTNLEASIRGLNQFNSNAKSGISIWANGATANSQVEVFRATIDGIGLPITLEFSDNASALAGGLAVGTIYRTGDLLKIVH